MRQGLGAAPRLLLSGCRGLRHADFFGVTVRHWYGRAQPLRLWLTTTIHNAPFSRRLLNTSRRRSAHDHRN
jgi:hypothetical protein